MNERGPWLQCSRVSPSNEGQVRKHGAQGRRQWRKVHLAMDAATSDIRAVEFTPSRDGDSPVLPERLDQIPENDEIGTVTGDGAYDTRRCHTTIVERRATRENLGTSDWCGAAPMGVVAKHQLEA